MMGCKPVGTGAIMFLRTVKTIGALATLFLIASTATAQEISSWLMNSTFRVEGPDRAKAGSTLFGTVFVLGKPVANADDKASKESNYVLITAAHVLEGISGEQAILTLRRRNADGSYVPFPYSEKIRDGLINRYVVPPNADVAAMYVSLPGETAITPLPTDFLLDDARLEHLEVHPGDELLSLGFPLYVDLNGFAVVRSGLLASYPLTPSKVVGRFYYNFHIFPGNSGGPVYFDFANRAYGGVTHIGHEWGIIGLVSQQVSPKLFPDEKLDVSVIVPSTFIKEAIGMLPPTPVATAADPSQR
jgi:hypothetical protein